MKRKPIKGRSAKRRTSAGTTKKSSKKRAGKKARITTPAARKAASRKRAEPVGKTRKGVKPKEVLGEGNYTASRNFRRKQSDFVRRNSGRIATLGKKAEAALEGAERSELEQAAEIGRSHSHAPDEET